jgi:hypothetical protein
MENNLPEPFGTQVGLRQGDALSRILFNLALEYTRIFRESRVETKGTVHKKTIQVPAYADHSLLLGRTTDVLIEVIINPNKAARKVGLTINLQKLNTWK